MAPPATFRASPGTRCPTPALAAAVAHRRCSGLPAAVSPVACTSRLVSGESSATWSLASGSVPQEAWRRVRCSVGIDVFTSVASVAVIGGRSIGSCRRPSPTARPSGRSSCSPCSQTCSRRQLDHIVPSHRLPPDDCPPQVAQRSGDEYLHVLPVAVLLCSSRGRRLGRRALAVFGPAHFVQYGANSTSTEVRSEAGRRRRLPIRRR